MGWNKFINNKHGILFMEDKKFPVKILDGLYVFGTVGSDKSKKEEFLKLGFMEKIEKLVLEKPSARKVKVSGTTAEFYTSAFGDFVISFDGKYYLKEQDEKIVLKEAEDLFSILKEEYERMNHFCGEMKEFFYANGKH
jgi:hypothetical protein